MRKTLKPCLVLLALAALTVAPGFAADLDQVTEAQVDLPVEEPLMTPAEGPGAPELVDLPRDWEEKVRICTEQEAEEYCGPGCDCLIIANNPRCLC